MQRFTVLHHDWPVEHLDLLLQIAPDHLAAWRLPSTTPIDFPTMAQALPAHRLIYLDYQGPIAQNRGNVTRYDTGSLHLIQSLESCIEVHLTGLHLQGNFRLLREQEPFWRFEHIVA
jgi:hypothetical protein